MSLRCQLCATFVVAFALATLGLPAARAATAERQVIGHSVQGRPIVGFAAVIPTRR